MLSVSDREDTGDNDSSESHDHDDTNATHTSDSESESPPSTVQNIRNPRKRYHAETTDIVYQV